MTDGREARGSTLGEQPGPDTAVEQAAARGSGEDDFADEHNDLSLADEMSGGPEGQPEDDSPHGLAGAD
jgi:hypothetical protein